MEVLKHMAASHAIKVYLCAFCTSDSRIFNFVEYIGAFHNYHYIVIVIITVPRRGRVVSSFCGVVVVYEMTASLLPIPVSKKSFLVP